MKENPFKMPALIILWAVVVTVIFWAALFLIGAVLALMGFY